MKNKILNNMTSKFFTMVFNKNNEIIVDLEIFHQLMVVVTMASPYHIVLYSEVFLFI
jgi:hypothetical protein